MKNIFIWKQKVILYLILKKNKKEVNASALTICPTHEYKTCFSFFFFFLDEEEVGGMFPWSKITFPTKSKSLFFVPFIFFPKNKNKKIRGKKRVENQGFCN